MLTKNNQEKASISDIKSNTLSIYEMIEQTSIKYDRLFKRLTEPLLHYGINYFCYQFVSNEGHWFTLGNNPGWLLHSAEQRFYQCDPTLVHPNYYQASSTCFPQNHRNELFQQTLNSHAVYLFDIDHALALIEPHPLGCEYFFFGAPKHHDRALEVYLTQLNRLRYDYIHYIKTNLQPIYSHFLEYTVNLNKVNPIGFHASNNVLSIEDPMKQEIAFLKAIKNTKALSPREHQCLQLYQQGLTAKETAIRLRLSHRTIEGYLDNIKSKYQVRCKRELLNPLLTP